jgi:hypothetical protein
MVCAGIKEFGLVFLAGCLVANATYFFTSWVAEYQVESIFSSMYKLLG